MSFIMDLLDGGVSSAAKANKKENAWQKGLFNQSSSLGESFLLKALANIDVDFASAANELSKAGEVATTQILGQGKQALAAGQQALTDSGFSGSMAAALPGQVAAQTNQSLAALGEALGTQKANLATQHAGMKLQGAQGFGNWVLSKVNTGLGTSAQAVPQGGGLLSGLGETLGKGVGSWAAGFLPGGGS